MIYHCIFKIRLVLWRHYNQILRTNFFNCIPAQSIESHLLNHKCEWLFKVNDVRLVYFAIGKVGSDDGLHSTAFIGRADVGVRNGRVIDHSYDGNVHIDSQHEQIGESHEGHERHDEPRRQCI